MATFLPKGKRIHLKLRKATLNRGGSTRQHNFNLSLDLTEGDDTLTGLPEWLQNAYTNLARIGNCTALQKFDVVLSDVILEFYGTAKSRQKLWPVVTKAKLSKFVMERTGDEDEEVEVKLTFTAVFDTTKQIYDWVFADDDMEFWMAAESPQQELNLSGDNAAAAASDDDDDTEDDKDDDEEDDEESDDDEDEDDEEEEEEEEQKASASAAESQSAKAIRIRKEAESNAAKAAPAARPALIGNVPRRATVVTQ